MGQQAQTPRSWIRFSDFSGRRILLATSSSKYGALRFRAKALARWGANPSAPAARSSWPGHLPQSLVRQGIQKMPEGLFAHWVVYKPLIGSWVRGYQSFLAVRERQNSSHLYMCMHACVHIHTFVALPEIQILGISLYFGPFSARSILFVII